jgi:hypothetical protein
MSLTVGGSGRVGGLLFSLLAAACIACGSSDPDRRPNADASRDTTTVEGPLGEWGIPVLATKAVKGAIERLGNPYTDGERLYAHRLGADDEPTHLLRLDPTTGAVLAEHPYEPIPEESYEYDAVGTWLTTGSAIVLLEGDRNDAAILDPDTLAVRSRVALPPNTRSYVPFTGKMDSPIWIGHRRNDVDLAAGVETFMGATNIDTETGVGTTRETPACGTVGGPQPTESLLVVDVNCTEQIAFIDLETGKTDIVPAFQRQTDIGQLGDGTWARWRTLGFVGKIDPSARTFQALDLNAEGPLLGSMGALSLGDGDVWVLGSTADPDLVSVVYRIDPDKVEVVARASSEFGVAVIDGVGYTLNENRQLATFDPASVRGGKPTKVVRPESATVEPHRPRNADEREVIDTFLKVYDHRQSNEAVAELIEDAEQLAPVRTGLVELARTTFPDVVIVVTQVTLSDTRASIVYSFLVNGQPALGTLVGSMRRTGATWKVTRDTLCRFALEASTTPAC